MSTESVTRIRVAFAGNPNSGKSTVFNHMTGARQHVGNFPGVTVERYEGRTTSDGVTVDIIDLPGLYSIDSKNDEEKVAGDYLRNEEYDAIVDVVDASALERNLYLTEQLKELNRPIVVALNMVDVARRRGIEIDVEKLSQELGLPVIETVASRGKGVRDVLKKMTELGIEGRLNPRPAPVAASADRDVEIPEECSGACPGCSHGCVRVVALDMQRFKQINEICTRVVQHTAEIDKTFSDRVDAVLTNRFLGIPIFLVLMYIVFWLTFTLGAYPMDWIESGFNWLGEYFSEKLPEGSFLQSLIVDGVIGGVGGVIVFLPNIIILFLAISFLEDSGYLARAAVLCDRWMSKLGLPGRSIVPFLVGFGCGVPAMMSTRMILNKKERFISLFVIPFFSCGARLPIYALLIPAFFVPKWQAPVLWMIYILGIIVAMIVAKIMSLAMKQTSESTSFLIELPPYHLPTFRTVGLKTWERSLGYLKKAGTVILAASLILWFLTSYPKAPEAVAEKIQKDRASVEALLDDLPEGNNEEIVSALKGKINDLPDLSDMTKEELGKALDEAAAPTVNVDELKEALPGVEELALSETAVAGALDAALEEEEAEEPVLTADSVKEILAEVESLDDEVREKLESLVEQAAVEPTLAAGNLGEQLGVVFDHEESQADLGASFSGTIGRVLEPILRPLGFDWKIGTALVGAIAAKEVFVAQMGIVYSVGEEDEASLGEILQKQYTPLQALCMMVFCLLSAPCAASLAVMAKETQSWAWAWGQFFTLEVVAWIVTFLFYQVGIRFFA